MGGAVTKTSVDVVNSAIINAINRSVNKCTSLIENTQEIHLQGFSLFALFFQNAKLSVKCLQDVKITNKLSLEIAQNIQTEAKAKSIALLPSYSNSENTASLANYIQNSLTNEIMQDCAAGVIQKQKLSVNGFHVGLAAIQAASLYNECLQKMLIENHIADGIVQDVTQKATSEVANPLEFITDFLKGISWVFIVLIIGAVVVAYFVFRSPAAAGIGMPSIIVNVPAPMKSSAETESAAKTT